MSFKTVFIIIVSVLVTIVLMQNTDDVRFWLFGDVNVSKLAVLSVMFLLGFIVGYLVGRPRKKVPLEVTYPEAPPENSDTTRNDYLSDEDREYIR